jgi:hypothetical protein
MGADDIWFRVSSAKRKAATPRGTLFASVRPRTYKTTSSPSELSVCRCETAQGSSS